MKRKLVVILIITHKSTINLFEEISLRQCYRVLGNHPIRLICPSGLDVSCYQNIIPDVEIDFIDPYWQSNYRTYNRLRLSPFLYKQYRDYEFVLHYELDAFVFRDELAYWCSQGYSYIGAPWFEGWTKAEPESPIVGLGNGGFCLRNVDHSLRALNRFSYLIHPKELWTFWLEKGEPLKGTFSLLKNCTFTNNSFFLLNHFAGAEDFFWGHYIPRNFKWFKIPSVEEAMRFSFEVNSKLLFEKNGFSLPFGCHAWWKDELNFRLPHIKNYGYLKDKNLDDLQRS